MNNKVDRNKKSEISMKQEPSDFQICISTQNLKNIIDKFNQEEQLKNDESV